MRLRDKVTIVTGGSSGIGKLISRRFAAEGAIVAVVARDKARIFTVVDEIASDGGKAFATDLARPQVCAALIAEVVGQLGAVDVLVNNAGRYCQVVEPE